METEPLFCGANGDPPRGMHFRCVFYLFCISCFPKQRVFVSTVSNVVSNRFCLRGIWFSMAALYAASVESSGHFGSVKEMGKHILILLLLGGSLGVSRAQNPSPSPALFSAPMAPNTA